MMIKQILESKCAYGAFLAALIFKPDYAHAQEREKWITGHGDLSVSYIQDQFVWNIWEGEDPRTTIVCLGPTTQVSIPDLESFSFLGDPGTSIWIAPMVEDGSNIFMGMHTEGTQTGTFENNRFQIGIDGLQGPGNFFMWTTGGAGSVDLVLNTKDGITTDDRIDAPAPGHWHQNWAFDMPGTYLIHYNVEGKLVESGEVVRSVSEPIRYAVNVFDRGEIDLEIAYEDGEWEWGLLEESTETLHLPGEAALHLSPASWQIVPDDARYSFLGQPGQSVYVCPQDEQEDILFLGIAADEIPAGVFEKDTLSLSLTKVEGPGAVSLYSSDAFGNPTLLFDSSDGLGEDDLFPMSVGGHAHQNWAFTEPGYYQISLQASATLANGTPITSEEATFFFEVFAPTFSSEGELDIEVAFKGDDFELVALDEVNEREIFPSELVLMASDQAQQIIPEDTSYSFLGAAGDTVYVLPQEEQEGVLTLA